MVSRESETVCHMHDMLTDCLIAVLLVWFWGWDLPRDRAERWLVGWVRWPFLWLGLWHSWSMFAPEPLHVNRRLRAVMELADGSIEEWRPLEPLRSNWLLDLLWFRHFKYQFSVLSGSSRWLWPPLCEWLIRQVSARGEQVARIQLIREYQSVQSPDADSPLTPWQSSVMYEMVVPPVPDIPAVPVSVWERASTV